MNDIQIIDNARTRLAWRSGYLLASFGIFLADQASKAWAVRELRFGQDRTVISGFFDFIYTENPGIAFGQLQEGGAFGRWFFVALVVTPTDATLYLDGGEGLKSATHAMAHGVMPMAGSFMIGLDKATAGGLRYWNGAIDDVRVWKRALSREEIEASMNTAPAAGDPGLLAWWNFDETTVGEREVPLFTEPVSSLRAASAARSSRGSCPAARRTAESADPAAGPETSGSREAELLRARRARRDGPRSAAALHQSVAPSYFRKR